MSRQPVHQDPRDCFASEPSHFSELDHDFIAAEKENRDRGDATCGSGCCLDRNNQHTLEQPRAGVSGHFRG